MSKKKFLRDASSKYLAGVCSGIANYFDIDVTFVRIGFAFALLTTGWAFLLYFGIWLCSDNEYPPEDEEK